jgi:hypothetical protein
VEFLGQPRTRDICEFTDCKLDDCDDVRQRMSERFAAIESRERDAKSREEHVTERERALEQAQRLQEAQAESMLAEAESRGRLLEEREAGVEEREWQVSEREAEFAAREDRYDLGVWSVWFGWLRRVGLGFGFFLGGRGGFRV